MADTSVSTEPQKSMTCQPCLRQIECVCPLVCKLDERCSNNSHTCCICPRGKEIKFPEGQLKEHIAIEHNNFKNKICAWGPRCKLSNRCTRIHICPICTKSGNFDYQFENGFDLKRHLFDKHTFQSVFIQLTQQWEGIPLEFWKYVFKEVMYTNRLLFKTFPHLKHFKCFYSKDYFSTIWTFVRQDEINFFLNYCDGSCALQGNFLCEKEHKCLECGICFGSYEDLYQHIKNRHSIEQFSEKFPRIISEDWHYDYNTFKMIGDLLKERYSFSDNEYKKLSQRVFGKIG